MNKRNEIINATISNISKFGIDGTTMKKIADDCDIKSASIYYFFKNKNELALECLEVILKRHLKSQESINEISESEDTLTTLHRQLENVVDFHTSHPEDTLAYLQFVNYYDETFQNVINEYQFEYFSWLQQAFDNSLSNYLQDISNNKKLLEYVVTLSNALFWECIVYTKEDMEHRLDLAKDLLTASFEKLK